MHDVITALIKAKVFFSLGIIAKAVVVSVSGLKMIQNNILLTWQKEELEERLRNIMHEIYQQFINYGIVKDHAN